MFAESVAAYLFGPSGSENACLLLLSQVIATKDHYLKAAAHTEMSASDEPVGDQNGPKPTQFVIGSFTCHYI